MTDLLEIGQIGIIQDFPADIGFLEEKVAAAAAENAALSSENFRLRDILIIGGVVVAIGGLLYFLLKPSNVDEGRR